MAGVLLEADGTNLRAGSLYFEAEGVMSMPDSLHHALEKIYENQVALTAAIEELALWIEVRGDDAATAGSVRDALDTLERNAEPLGRWIAELHGISGQ